MTIYSSEIYTATVDASITMLLFAVACFFIPITAAFLVIPSSGIINHRRLCYTHHALYHRLYNQQTALLSTKSHQTENDWSINAIEEAREQFELLIGPTLFDDNDCTCSGNSIVSMDDKKKPHLLTIAGRKRREIEIRLLQSLQYSDDAIDELMALWIHECPNQIVNIDILQFMSSKDSSCTVTEAEMILRNVILHDCPISVWSEPGARLAYILFLQKQYEECEQYVQSVLSVKPWHFEMVQLQILLELSYRRNMSRAIHVARKYGLPPLHHIKQRYRWVKNATQQAQHQLQQMELYTETELHYCGLFGENDRRTDHQTTGSTVHHLNSTSSSLISATKSTISSWE